MTEDTYEQFREEESDTLVDKLRRKADEQQEMERLIEEAQATIDNAKTRLRTIAESEIPELMEGVQGSLQLNDGRKIVVGEKIRAHVSKDRMNAAVAWLDEHGHGNIVKRQITGQFSRDDHEKGTVDRAAEALKSLGVDPAVGYSIHHSTLTSFVKERMNEGEELDLALFGVQRIRTAQIK